jgi:hypothetical protein
MDQHGRHCKAWAGQLGGVLAPQLVGAGGWNKGHNPAQQSLPKSVLLSTKKHLIALVNDYLAAIL